MPNGICDKCYQLCQTSSSYCRRYNLIHKTTDANAAPSPVEGEKTADEILLRFDHDQVIIEYTIEAMEIHASLKVQQARREAESETRVGNVNSKS